MKLSLSALLSFNGGYVDTAGFVSLQGLFTAHVTGNFVTAGAALVFGTSGLVAKLLALPVFCVAVALVRVAGHVLTARNIAVLRPMLGLQVGLLVLGFIMAVMLGPFPNGDSWRAVATGMILVSAMAVQNAVQRIHLSSLPPATLMTGNTTQIVIDLVDIAGHPTPEIMTAARGRLARFVTSLAWFAAGCGAAALLFLAAGVWCFALPPLIAVATAIASSGSTPSTARPA